MTKTQSYSIGRLQAQFVHYAEGVKNIFPGIDDELAAALANLCRVSDGGMELPPAAYAVVHCVLSKAREKADQLLNGDIICNYCHGTGRDPMSDNISWLSCPNCEAKD